MTTFHTPAGVAVTAVTAEQMRAVDRVAVEEVGVELLQMMEHAGRALAAQVLAVADGPAIVVAGNGGNGGGGLACARHLANHAVDVTVVLDRPPEKLRGAPARQHRVLEAMAVPVRVGDVPADAAVLVDALIGYGLSGAVRESVATLVRAMNQHDGSVVSLDVPSGVDATSGERLGVAVDPERTVTLALPKRGLADRPEPLALADIGIPRVVYDRLDIAYDPPFEGNDWVTPLR